jgi:hypothetical protein
VKIVRGPICKIWIELKVEDDYGVSSPELHRKFTGICYNLRYRHLISDPLSPGARVRQEELTGNVGLISSLPEKSQPNEKQRQNFGDRLQRLQIEFQRDCFSYG